jgi:hypothetical protein
VNYVDSNVKLVPTQLIVKFVKVTDTQSQLVLAQKVTMKICNTYVQNVLTNVTPVST